MMRLLITDKIDESGLTPLKKYFRIEKKIGTLADYDCVLTRSSTAVPREFIGKSKNLKIIGRCGIGVDNIDIFAATEHKIAVINAPRGNARATAEHTIGLLFALLRHIPAATFDLKKGLWNKQKYVGEQVFGKTLGIVGFGNVGKEVARIARGIGMKVLVCEPYVRLPKNVNKVTFEELLKSCDVITLHVPSTYLTRQMINSATLSLMKKDAYLINCSRGAVVDEEAVYDALTSGELAGFALDVYKKEPIIIDVDNAYAKNFAEVGKTFAAHLPNSPDIASGSRTVGVLEKLASPQNSKPVLYQLLNLPNVIATPHIAGSTVESQRQSVNEVVSGICRYLEGKAPANLLNPQVFRKEPAFSRLNRDTARQRKRLDFDSVIFDCESTLSAIEGIDVLAEMAGKRKIVEELTRKAMDGISPFETIYEERLKIVKPTRMALLALGNKYLENLVEDAKGVIEALQFLGKKVYIVSGGISTALFHLGEALGLSRENIFGNDLLFDKKGNYKNFIEGPLRRNHGKLQIIRQLTGRKIVIGDGITDLETRECIDLFVGYGGVVRREKVEKESEVFLNCNSLTPFLVIAAGTEGCKKLMPTKYRKYVGRGLDLLFHPKHVKITRGISLKLGELKKLAYY